MRKKCSRFNLEEVEKTVLLGVICNEILKSNMKICNREMQNVTNIIIYNSAAQSGVKININIHIIAVS